MSAVTSVDAYIRTHPTPVQAILRRVRAAIRKAVPDAEETMSYKMPTYSLGGARVIYFAGWKQHYALYPATPRLVAALGDALAPYVVAKGTIRFPLTASVPTALIARIATLRAREARAPRAGRAS